MASKQFLSVLALLGVSLSMAGCGKDGAPAAEGARAPTPTTAAASAAADATAQSKFDESTFSLELKAPGPYSAGSEGQATIALSAKAPFHCNDKYPYKFKLEPSDTLTVPAPVVGKDALALEKTSAELTVKFTPKAPGKHRLAGEFSFSVCSADKCLIEKRKLSAEVSVQ
ncbi:MAG: hypothetical protein R3B13_37830 [Polyangiaceae bacterium]